MKKLPHFLRPVFVTLFFTAAVAQFAKPEDAIKYRKAVMTLIGNHFGRMASVVKGQQPYVRADFSNDAELVERLSKLPWEAFMVGDRSRGHPPEASRPLAKNPNLLKPASNSRPRHSNSSVPQTVIISGPLRISSGRSQNRARAATGSSGPISPHIS